MSSLIHISYSFFHHFNVHGGALWSQVMHLGSQPRQQGEHLQRDACVTVEDVHSIQGEHLGRLGSCP